MAPNQADPRIRSRTNQITRHAHLNSQLQNGSSSNGRGNSNYALHFTSSRLLEPVSQIHSEKKCHDESADLADDSRGENSTHSAEMTSKMGESIRKANHNYYYYSIPPRNHNNDNDSESHFYQTIGPQQSDELQSPNRRHLQRLMGSILSPGSQFKSLAPPRLLDSQLSPAANVEPLIRSSSWQNKTLIDLRQPPTCSTLQRRTRQVNGIELASLEQQQQQLQLQLARRIELGNPLATEQLYSRLNSRDSPLAIYSYGRIEPLGGASYQAEPESGSGGSSSNCQLALAQPASSKSRTLLATMDPISAALRDNRKQTAGREAPSCSRLNVLIYLILFALSILLLAAFIQQSTNQRDKIGELVLPDEKTVGACPTIKGRSRGMCRYLLDRPHSLGAPTCQSLTHNWDDLNKASKWARQSSKWRLEPPASDSKLPSLEMSSWSFFLRWHIKFI